MALGLDRHLRLFALGDLSGGDGNFFLSWPATTGLAMSDDHNILNYELFPNDETSVRVLSNKMVVTTKKHTCVICSQDIAIKARVRCQREINNDDHVAGSFYVCALCCIAIVKRHEDDGRAIENRSRLGCEIE